MSKAQTHSQKTEAAAKLTAKAVSKVTGHGVMVESKPKKGNSEAHPGSGPSISAQERQIRIARTAYLRAEKRGFAPGGELQDWVEAETEVLRLTGGA
jgi:hypothetical protein